MSGFDARNAMKIVVLFWLSRLRWAGVSADTKRHTDARNEQADDEDRRQKRANSDGCQPCHIESLAGDTPHG